MRSSVLKRNESFKLAINGYIFPKNHSYSHIRMLVVEL